VEPSREAFLVSPHGERGREIGFTDAGWPQDDHVSLFFEPSARAEVVEHL
jgi:hypothetical protein